MARNEYLLLLITFISSLLRAEEAGDNNANNAKKLNSGAILTTRNINEGTDEIRITTGDKCVSLTSCKNSLSGFTLMKRDKGFVTFFTDFDLDAEYDLREVCKLSSSGLIDEATLESCIFINGKWIPAKKNGSQGGYTIESKEEYRFQSGTGKWAVIIP